METIQTYLDNLFSAYPRTPEVLNAKAALQNHMEDKYTELKSQGKTENEAIGIVISEFGNIDELMSELNVTPITSSTDIGTVSVSREEASHYISVKKKDSLFTAIGVSAILLGVIVLMLGAAFLPQLQNAHIDLANPVTLTDQQGILAICPLFICIAIAVSLFIISGNNMKPYEHLKSLNINLSASTRAYLKECRDKYRSFYTLFTVLGIVLCILAPMVLLGMVAFLGDSDTAGCISVSVMLALIGVGVFFLIYANGEQEAYHILLQEEDFSRSRKRSNRTMNIIGSVYWPLICFIYLGWSFWTLHWAYTWVIWPVAGILYVAIRAIVNAVSSPSKNE